MILIGKINFVHNHIYDGASSMQSQYSGVCAYIQEKNLRVIYVWCFSHILNLVVVDTCDTSKTMRNFFGDLQSLIAFLRARKRTVIFLNHQKICYPEKEFVERKIFLLHVVHLMVVL